LRPVKVSCFLQYLIGCFPENLYPAAYWNARPEPIIRPSATVISIKRYLQADRETENALLRLAQLLIEGVARSAAEGLPVESPSLHESTRQVLAALESGAPPEELLGHAARAMDALKQHNQEVVEYLRRPVAELQLKVKLLTAAITAVSSTSDATIGRLRQIKGQLLSTVGAREIQSLKVHLSECLDGVLAEAQRQRDASDRAAEHLNRSAVQPLNSPGAGGPATDPATGLPARGRAEEAIAQACQDEAPAFVVVMAINQLQNLNRSFGVQVGDAILQRFVAVVREQLPAIDQLFRWSGPTIVSLVRRRSAHEVRGAIQPILARNLGHTVNTFSGDVHVPISSRWIVLPLMASPRLLFHKIDSFAGSE
jgi:GGDEF domain-containing protein